MADTQQFDLVIIGGGPAGYVGAIRAAQLGLQVACVERDKLGGVCNNWGCIPTKALLANAELYHKLKHQQETWGIAADNVRFDWGKVISRSRGIADTGAKGVGSLFKKNKVTHLEGHAFIPKAGVVEVYAKDDAARKGKPTQTLQTKRILIATGAAPRELPGAAFDGEKIISSKEAMNLKEQPKKLLIIGAGAIGMEFAYFYNAFGTEVTIVEMLDRVLPVEDHEVSKEMRKSIEKIGIKVYTGHKTLKVEKTDKGIKATIAPVESAAPAPAASEKSYSASPPGKSGGSAASAAASSGAEITIEADKVLVAIGVKGKYDGLFGDALKLEIFKDHIKVDARKPGATYETNIKGVYAVGDVIGPPWLAHVASEEAVVCVERIAGHEVVDIDYDSIPGCTYCHPQVASIGFTEQKCKELGLEYTVGKFPFLASGKARALGDTTGFVKVIAGKKHGEILGAHMIGDNVTELIAEFGLARRLEATAEEIIATIHAHPTMSEGMHEAVLGTQGRMLHF